MTIQVEESWLQSLLLLAERAKKDQEKWYEGTKELMPSSMSALIGYASSAETLLKFCKKEKQNEKI